MQQCILAELDESIFTVGIYTAADALRVSLNYMALQPPQNVSSISLMSQGAACAHAPRGGNTTLAHAVNTIDSIDESSCNPGACRGCDVLVDCVHLHLSWHA